VPPAWQSTSGYPFGINATQSDGKLPRDTYNVRSVGPARVVIKDLSPVIDRAHPREKRMETVKSTSVE
jgi:hypothetical protein